MGCSTAHPGYHRGPGGLFRHYLVEPQWHYHPKDISSLVEGFLAAQGRLPDPPYKSDALSKALGIDPAEYARHTAMGDVLWTLAQWRHLMRGNV